VLAFGEYVPGFPGFPVAPALPGQLSLSVYAGVVEPAEPVVPDAPPENFVTEPPGVTSTPPVALSNAYSIPVGIGVEPDAEPPPPSPPILYVIADVGFVPATVPVLTEPGSPIVPLLTPAELPLTEQIPTTPFIMAVSLTNTLKPFVRRTEPNGTVKLLTCKSEVSVWVPETVRS
jgi:hypothetical protein